MVTMKDIAQIVGVSESTVSRVLSKSPEECPVSMQLQEKIRNVAEKLRYQPNLMARGLATQKSGNIGFVIYRYEHLTNPVMIQIISGVAKAISYSKYSLLIEAIYQPGKVHETRHKLISLFARRQVDGLIIAAHETDPVEILELVKEEYPFVLASFYVPGLTVDNVRVDFKRIGETILRFFADRGHREIAIMPGPKYFFEIPNHELEHLISGVQAVAMELGIKIPSERIVFTDFDEDEAYHAAMNLLSQEVIPTAIYTADDAMAIGVIKAIQQKGYKVPQDISVLCGADTPRAQFASVPLSTIKVPYNDMGFKAAEVLLGKLQQEIKDNRQIFLPFEIVNRCSVISKHE